MNIAFYVFLPLITFGSVSLLKAYTHLPLKEIKRRARSGDELATLIYKASNYETSMQILLWFFIGFGATGFFVSFSRSVSAPIAVLIGLIFVWLGFAWMPNTRSATGLTAARLLATPLAWMLNLLHPILGPVAKLVNNRIQSKHTGLYEKDDLLDLLEAQSGQSDSRFSEAELKAAHNALTFGDRIIREIMTPPKSIVAISDNEILGPILLTELYDSGKNRFPVYHGKNQDEIVGTLYLKDLINVKSGGKISTLMSKDVYYMHDEEPLDQALAVMLKSKHNLFIVVNRFDDLVGVVTIEAMLEQILGTQIEDEFGQFNDRTAVAKYKGVRLTKPDDASVSVETVVESDEISSGFTDSVNDFALEEIQEDEYTN
ncbi:MAG: CBS domain-containing protein [Candidatus Saccharibacteria bacterium]